MNRVSSLGFLPSCYIQLLHFGILRFLALLVPVENWQQDIQQPVSDICSDVTLKAFFCPQPPSIYNTGNIFNLPPELAKRILVVFHGMLESYLFKTLGLFFQAVLYLL